jgi:hypothetical protein
VRGDAEGRGEAVGAGEGRGDGHDEDETMAPVPGEYQPCWFDGKACDVGGCGGLFTKRKGGNPPPTCSKFAEYIGAEITPRDIFALCRTSKSDNTCVSEGPILATGICCCGAKEGERCKATAGGKERCCGAKAGPSMLFFVE